MMFKKVLFDQLSKTKKQNLVTVKWQEKQKILTFERLEHQMAVLLEAIDQLEGHSDNADLRQD